MHSSLPSRLSCNRQAYLPRHPIRNFVDASHQSCGSGGGQQRLVLSEPVEEPVEIAVSALPGKGLCALLVTLLEGTQTLGQSVGVSEVVWSEWLTLYYREAKSVCLRRDDDFRFRAVNSRKHPAAPTIPFSLPRGLRGAGRAGLPSFPYERRRASRSVRPRRSL
jgi:hypothetical protein